MMKSYPQLKWTTGIVFLAVVLGTGYYLLLKPEAGLEKQVAVVPDASDKFFGWRFPVVKFPITGAGDLAYSDIRDPGGIPQGLPVRLKIPIIGVDAAIEDALITIDGRMDVPSGSVDVAWFALGPHPGQEGSAVIGGHFGIRNGVKFVFYDLDKLKEGDKIYIEDDKGDTLAFIVRSSKLFDRESDATTVFTSHDGLAHLNLITCEGIWNRVNDNYPKRRVVFTDAIPTEEVGSISPSIGKGVSKAEDIAAFPRSLNIGMQGADVTALQVILKEKGFLIMPSGAVYGFFGKLTSASVAKYQTSAGLPPVGIFGPLTKAKLISELGGDTALPNTGEEKIEAPSNILKSSTSSQMLSEFVNALFDTPRDGLITSILLLSVAFMAFKIIRRK